MTASWEEEDKAAGTYWEYAPPEKDKKLMTRPISSSGGPPVFASRRKFYLWNILSWTFLAKELLI